MSLDLNLTANTSVAILQYKLRQLGWQGWLGMLLLTLSLVTIVLVTIPRTQNLQQLTNDIVALKVHQNRGVTTPKSDTQFDKVKKFYTLLPRQLDANQKVAEILHTANKSGLIANKVEYATQSASSPLMQYQIKLPVQGSYIQVRQFINHVLNTLPAVALNELSLKREDIATDLVDAKLQFTIYLKRD